MPLGVHTLEAQDDLGDKYADWRETGKRTLKGQGRFARAGGGEGRLGPFSAPPPSGAQMSGAQQGPGVGWEGVHKYPHIQYLQTIPTTH